MRNSFDPGGSAPEVKMDPNAVHNCSGINCGVCATLRRNATEATLPASRVNLRDVRKYAHYYLGGVGSNDPLLFLWALGIEIVREDGSIVGDDCGGQST